MKRSVLVESGGQDPELQWFADWFALLVAAFPYGLCYVPEGLAGWRAGRGSCSRRWFAQREVVWRLLYLLKSPAYRDVLPFFKGSGVLSFPPYMLYTLAFAPEHWDCLSWLLVRRVVPYSIRHFLPGATAVAVERAYHSARQTRVARISRDTGSFEPRVST